jgi:hypothetical protein
MKNIVEINGRSYDARTGRLLAKRPSSSIANPGQASAILPPAQAPKTHSNGVVLDGIRRRKSAKNYQSQNLSKRPAVSTNTSPAAKNPTVILNEPARQTERAKTLLRSIVKKPFSPIAAKPQEINLHEQPSKNALAKRTSSSKTDNAKSTMRSTSVSRFNNLNRQKPKLTTDLKLVPIPKAKNAIPDIAPAIIQPKANHKKEQVFNHTIIQANNHLLKKLPKEKLYAKFARTLNVGAKTLAVSAAILAVVVFASFLAYQKIPSVAMRVAANRAGFSGHLPSNIPAGFSFKGPLMYSKGSIVINYMSNSDNRKFSIIQKPTEWTSESLLTNFLLDSKLPYQTYHDSGLTVYVYNEGEATWVDKGVWYSINGEGILSFDQILSIASSM